MTHEQATRELARLCQALGKDPKDLKEAQTAAWLEALRELPYERGRLAVTAVYKTWDKPSFPPPGYLLARAKEVDLEGHPNAAAYSQDGSGTPWERTEEARFALWRQDQIVAMDEAEYSRFLHDRGFREQKEREWRRRWESDGNEAGRATA